MVKAIIQRSLHNTQRDLSVTIASERTLFMMLSRFTENPISCNRSEPWQELRESFQSRGQLLYHKEQVAHIQPCATPRLQIHCQGAYFLKVSKSNPRSTLHNTHSHPIQHPSLISIDKTNNRVLQTINFQPNLSSNEGQLLKSQFECDQAEMLQDLKNHEVQSNRELRLTS